MKFDVVEPRIVSRCQVWKDQVSPGWIEIERNFSPVDRVGIRVEEEAEGAVLFLKVTTDGTVSPERATVDAASLLAVECESAAASSSDRAESSCELNARNSPVSCSFCVMVSC